MAVARLADEERPAAPHDGLRLAQHELDEARIVLAARDLERPRATVRPPRARARAPRPSRRPSVRCRGRRRPRAPFPAARRRRRAGRRDRRRARSSPIPSTPMTWSELMARRTRSQPRRAGGSSRDRASARVPRPRRSPSASTSGTRARSASSSTNEDGERRQQPCDAEAPGAGPSVSSIPASGPLTALPAMIGEIATTRSRRATSASRTPSTARIGSSETNGFDGASTSTSASWIASSTPGAGRAGRPSKRTERTRSTARWPTSHCWKSSSPSSVPMNVRRRSSVAGSRRTRRPSLAARSAVIDDSGSPARSRSLRTRCSPMSRSPRMNQSAPPSSDATVCASRVSPATPQPLTGSMRPESV